MNRQFQLNRTQSHSMGYKLWLRMKLVPSPLWFAVLAVILLAGGRFSWHAAHRPAHLGQLIDECTSITDFFYRMPMPDSTGTRISYSQDTETGTGLFLKDIASGKTQLLYDQKEGEGQLDRRRFCRLFWSPDDSLFAYVHNIQHKSKSEEILIFHAQTGRTEKVLCDSVNGPFWNMTDCVAAWLSSESLVYATTEPAFHLIRKEGAEWKETARFAPHQLTDVPSFVAATSSHNIVWRQENTLWMLDVSAPNAPVKLFVAFTNNPAMSGLTAVSYSPEKQSFLLSCLGEQKESLWQLSLVPGSTKPTRLLSAPSVREAKWINGGKGYAYISRNATNNSLVVQTTPGAKTLYPFLQGNVADFTTSSNGRRLFALGVVSNEISSAIWQYDVEAASLQCVVPYSDHPLRYARHINPLIVSLTLLSGVNAKLNLYLPPGSEQHPARRYPLLIGCPSLVASPIVRYPFEFANCGIIYADLQTSGSVDDGLDQWKDSLAEVYDCLAQKQYVDPRRIFFSAVSRETWYLSQYMSENPRQCKGLLLLNPSGLPDLRSRPGLRRPKILISAGALSDGERRLRQFQEKAASLGDRVDVFMREGAGHTFVSKASVRARMREMVEFIFDN